MPLDMFGQTQADTDAYVARHNAPRLPATFSDAFTVAWDENRLFGQSVAGQNARGAALNDYLDDVTRRTGERFEDLPAELQDPSLLMPYINDKIAKLNAANPDLKLEPLSEESLDRRAVAKSRIARSELEEMNQREKTFGGSIGQFLGGAAGTATDPVNLVVAPVAAPEGLGLFATAMAWAGIAGGTQAAIEVVGSSYRDQVQPGYSQGAEPARNILGAAAFGGVTGGALKSLGMGWTRLKTGEWPRSIRDAGNVVESEANIANSNILPGLEGEIAHREALGKAIDDIMAGRRIDVPDETLAPHEAWVDAMMGNRGAARVAAEEEAAARAAPAPELPLEPTKTEVHEATIADGVQGMARITGYDMPREEAERVAKMVAGASSDEQARAILSAAMDRPQTVAEFPPSPLPKKAPEELPGVLEPKTVNQAVGSPELEQALRADIDRARATEDVKIPIDVDKDGNPVFRSVDGAMEEIDAYKKAAEQIKACAAPQPEPAEAA